MNQCCFKNLRKRLFTVFGEHGHESVQDGVSLVLISCGDLDKDVLGIQCDLGVVRVDNRRQ